MPADQPPHAASHQANQIQHEVRTRRRFGIAAVRPVHAFGKAEQACAGPVRAHRVLRFAADESHDAADEGDAAVADHVIGQHGDCDRIMQPMIGNLIGEAVRQGGWKLLPGEGSQGRLRRKPLGQQLFLQQELGVAEQRRQLGQVQPGAVAASLVQYFF